MAVHIISEDDDNDLPDGFGWIYEYACLDPDCYSGCKLIHRSRVKFGICYSVDGCSQSYIHQCKRWHMPTLVQAQYNNGYCTGSPNGYAFSDRCYPTPFGYDSSRGECWNGEKKRQRRWYKYSCRPENLHAEEDGVRDVNVGIVLAILSFVCLIGVVVGLLIRRRKIRKISSELLLNEI